MPFRSEKQRRFLWAKHPEIAKEWAHKYPDSNKGLPMYAHEKKDDDQPVSKEAALAALQSVVVNSLKSSVKSIFASACDKNTKKADSKLEQIQVPQDDKPTYAGEKPINSVLKPETEDEGSIGESRSTNEAEINTPTRENPLLQKLAVILAPKIQQDLENIKAQQEARNANSVPQNAGVKKYPVVNNTIPPPMGMTAPPQAPQAPQQPQQPAQQQPQNGQMAPVGGGNSPNANPINSFGGISMNGDINGNAAFGTQNQMGGEKMAGILDFFKSKPDANAWAPPATPVYNHDPDSDDDYEKQRKQYEHALRKYLTSRGYSDIKAHHYEPGGTPWSMRNAAGKHHEIWLPEDDQPVGEPVPLENVYSSDNPDEVYRKGPGLVLINPTKKASAAKCSCGCGQKVNECTCPPSCSCRQKGGSCYGLKKQADSPAWQRSEGKNEAGGLNAKGRASYNRATGGNLKAPVTENNPSGDRAKRQNSFCSRMCGMKRHETGAKTKADPDSRINKSLRKWNCKCGSEKTALELPLWNYTLQAGLDRHNTPYLAIPTGLGALAGGAYGAYTAPKGKKLKHGLIGTGIGGALGLGSTVIGDALIGPGAKLWPKVTGTKRKLQKADAAFQEADDHNQALSANRPDYEKMVNARFRGAHELIHDNALPYDHPHNVAARKQEDDWWDGYRKYQQADDEWQKSVAPQWRHDAVELGLARHRASIDRYNSEANGAMGGYFGGSAAGIGLGGLGLHSLYQRYKHRDKKKQPEKQAQDFDPALSRDAENSIMHGTGLVGSAALGTIAGMPLSAGLGALAEHNNWIPSSEKNFIGHHLANSVIKLPMFLGGTLGMSLYDNYILRPHLRRAAQQKEEELRRQIVANPELAKNVLAKRAGDASLGRVLGTMASSVGGGLILGSYPGWRLQRASEHAGNHDFVNFVAGKAPIAIAGAGSAALFNHLYDQYENKKKPKAKPEPESALKYLQYLVH